MRHVLLLVLTLSLLTGCMITQQLIDFTNKDGDSFSQSQTAISNPYSIQSITPSPLTTLCGHTLTNTPTSINPQKTTPPLGNSITKTPNPENLQEQYCDGFISAKVVEAPELTKDLFEHHALGIFLIVQIEMTNLTKQPIQIWDGDYFIEGYIDSKKINYTPQKAATGYLFITRGGNLYQDQLMPGFLWKTYLAFDINPMGKDWVLIISPGSEIGSSTCQLRLPLTD